MRVFDLIVAERERMADLLDGLTPEQLGEPSLCAGWTVHDVAAHLVTFLRFGQAKLYWGVLTTAGDIDRVNLALTRRIARRPSAEIADLLRRRARSRTTIPRSGYDPVLTDLVLHDLDVRLPLGIPRSAPEEPLRVALNHLAGRPALGFGVGARLAGLRLEATDTGWSHGSGPPVRGDAEALLLGISGRSVAFDDLDGDGVPLLRQRIASQPRVGPARRTARALGVLVHPPPKARRSREALAVG